MKRALLFAVACYQPAHLTGDAGATGGPDAPTVGDAPPDSACGWRVTSNVDPCAYLQPMYTGAWAITGLVTIDTNTATLSGSFCSGCQFERVSDGFQTFALVQVGSLHVGPGGSLVASGDTPLVILSNGDVGIEGDITFSDAASAGVGIGRNGGAGTPGGGGGGAGYGTAGASGGDGNGIAGGGRGSAYGFDTDVPLVVGSRGGDTGSVGGGGGGKGGGAIQISCNAKLTLQPGATIQANAGIAQPGGGGGAGGAILIEADTLMFVAGGAICANGGGGGGAGTASMPPTCDGTPAPGGGGAGAGGAGAAGTATPVVGGSSTVPGVAGGGGGGAVGRIHFNGNAAAMNATVSPPATTN